MSIPAEAITRITGVVGADRSSTEPHVLHSYAKSVDSISDRRRPAMVVKPKTTEHVVEVVKIANEYLIPILPRGNGSDLTMGTKPTKDGVIIMDLRGMDEIEIDLEANIVTVQPGVTWGKLLAETGKYGLYTGQLGPANSSATVGGSVSNASVGGGGEVMFGSIGDNVVSLEVVLPTGEVIQTGSNLSAFSKPWFGGRYIGGPDLAGMFIGDPGVFGIKTRISLKLQPFPPYWVTKTYLVPGDDVDAAKDAKNIISIFKEWEKGSYGIFALGYWSYSFVSALAGLEIFRPWTEMLEPGVPFTDGVVAVILNAWSEEALNANLRIVEAVLEKYGCKEFGMEIAEGNWARWMLEKTGNWSYFNPAWGISGQGPGCPVCVADAPWEFCIPLIESTMDHYNQNVRRFLDAKMSMSYMLTPVGGGAKLVWGYPSAEEIPESKTRQLRSQLIEEQTEIIFRGGAVPIWTGPLYSNKMLDIGMIKPSYLDFLTLLKKSLDPNGILSPGKFHFNE